MNKREQLALWASHLQGLKKGKSYKPKYLTYIASLLEYNLLIIFEVEHLAYTLGRSHQFLASVRHKTDEFYIDFKIPKKRGGYRKISSPYPSLLECQHWIKENILDIFALSNAAHGFVKSRSVITNATQHVGCDELLKLDIKDFFPSIRQEQVENLFYNIGYAPNVSRYLASICTLKERLPQGAATSPALSNILFYFTDEKILSLCKEYELIYTRYADDIAISGKKIPESLLSQIALIINSSGFELNKQKTVYISGNGRKIITGISVSGNSLKLPKETKRELRKQAYHLLTKGFENHCSSMGIRNIMYIESLIGKLNFWQQIEPENTFVERTIEDIRKISFY